MIIKLNEICSMDHEVKDKLSEVLKRIISNDNSKIIDDDITNNNIEGEKEKKANEIRIINENAHEKIKEKEEDNELKKEEEDNNTKQESKKEYQI